MTLTHSLSAESRHENVVVGLGEVADRFTWHVEDRVDVSGLDLKVGRLRTGPCSTSVVPSDAAKLTLTYKNTK